MINNNRGFDRIIAVSALIVSCVAAYYAYMSYNHDLTSDTVPDLSFQFFKIEGEQETEVDSVEADKNLIKRNDGFIEYELPLKLVNRSEVDANKITMWVGIENSDVTQSGIEGCNWSIGKKLKGSWIVGNFEHMSPSSEVKYTCLKIKAKEGTKEIKISWEVLASRLKAKKGELVLRF
jgi:hypothetical protein